MTTRCSFLVLAVLALATACGPTISYQRASAQTYPAKPASCELDVLTLPPQRSFVEIGTFDIANGDSVIDTSERLLNELRAQACQVGADAIFAQSNGQGVYVKATAIRYEGEHDDEAEDEPTVPPAAGATL